MSDVLDKLRRDRDQARSAAIALMEADDYNPESDAVKTAEERALALDSQIERLAAVYEQQRNADALDGKLAKQYQENPAGGSGVQERESIGSAFIKSDAFEQYRSAPHGRSASFDLSFDQERALPTGLADMATAGLDLGKTTRDTTAPVLPTPLTDAISRIQVSTNSVEFVKWTKVAGGADVVAEKGNKPSAEYVPEVESDTLDTVAVYTQLTRQLIEDAPAVRDKINGELVRDILRKEEDLVAAAIAAATLPTVVGSAAAGDDLLSVIREGIATVQVAGYNPTHVLLNPADWAKLDNVLMSSTLNGAQVNRSFFGLIPIASASQPEGTATVGDFKTAVEKYERSAVQLYVTDSHASTFLANVFTLLAERRSLTVVVREAALVEVSVGA